MSENAVDELPPITESLSAPQEPIVEEQAPVVEYRARVAPPLPPDLIIPPAIAEEEPEPDFEGEPESGKVIKAFNKTRKTIAIATADQLPLMNHMGTGVFALDLALLGGFCENDAFMIYGLESSSKTTLMLKQVANFQRKYPSMKCAWIDAEMSLDRVWASKNGVDLTRLYTSQPLTGEEGIDAMEEMLRCNDVCFVVVDSVPAMSNKATIERSSEDKTYGGNSSIIGVMMSKYLGAISDGRRRGHYPTLGIVNQIRDSMASFGSPYKIPGGRQLKYQTNTWVRLKGNKILGKDSRDNEIADYIEQAFVIEKNKCGTSLVRGEYTMALNTGRCGDKTIPAGIDIGITQVYEAATVISQARKMGFVHGGGGKYKIVDVNATFSTFKEIEAFLYLNPIHDLRLRQLIIATYRRENLLPAVPPDQYLLSWDLYI